MEAFEAAQKKADEAATKNALAGLAEAAVAPPPPVPANDPLGQLDGLSGDDSVEGIAFETKTLSLSE
jgi:hypothetical protein